MSVKDAGYGSCAAPCAAGKSLACSAFPYAHVNIVFVVYFYKFSICAFGENIIIFEQWADVLDVKCV